MREETFSIAAGAVGRRCFCMVGYHLQFCTGVLAWEWGRIIEIVGACRE